MNTPNAYKLKVYLKEIDEVQAMGNEEWIEMWATHVDTDAPFIARLEWLEYLTQCALTESKQLVA